MKYTHLILDERSVKLSLGQHIFPNGLCADPLESLYNLLVDLTNEQTPIEACVAIDDFFTAEELAEEVLQWRAASFFDCGWRTAFAKNTESRLIVSTLVDSCEGDEGKVLLLTSDRRHFELISPRTDVALVAADGQLDVWDDARFVAKHGHMPRYHPLYQVIAGCPEFNVPSMAPPELAKREIEAAPDAYALVRSPGTEDSFWGKVAEAWHKYEPTLSSRYEEAVITIY